MKPLRIAITVALLLALGGCGGGAPEDAHKSLNAALAALAKGDRTTFVRYVLPAQRSGALGVRGLVVQGVGKPVAQMTLVDILNVNFFREIKSGKTDDEFDKKLGDGRYRITTALDFGAKTSATRGFVMQEQGGRWLIDMSATLNLWVRVNGRAALTAIRTR